MQLPVAQLSLAAGLAAAGLARLALSRARHGPDGDCDAIKCLNLSSWDADKPHSFYLSDDSFLLADCEATVEGARLPLHSSLLFKQCQALQRVIERAQLEASGTGAVLDVTAAFKGCALLPAACCLRLLYRPQEANSSSFAVLARAGLLDEVAELALRLQAPRLLRGVKAFLQGMATRLAAEQASVPELATALAVAQKCSFSHASSGCLQAMAEKLTTGGAGGWQDGRQEAALATFDSATLARLVRSMSEKAGRRLYRSPPIFDVRPGGPGQAGGFTWAVPRFSRHSSGGSKHMERSSGGCLLSPWTEVAGFHWRVRLHPGGSGSGRGSHLSAFAQLDHTRALSAGHRSVAATFSLTVFDQGEGGRDFVAVFECQAGGSASGPAAGPAISAPRLGGSGSAGGSSAPRTGAADKAGSGDGPSAPGTPCRGDDGTAPSSARARQLGSSAGPRQGVFTKQTDTWGRHQFMELLELRRSDRSYLRGDRLLLRLDVRVHATDPA